MHPQVYASPAVVGPREWLRTPERAADPAFNFQARNSTTKRPPPWCSSTRLGPEAVGAERDMERGGCGHQGARPAARPHGAALACTEAHTDGDSMPPWPVRPALQRPTSPASAATASDAYRRMPATKSARRPSSAGRPSRSSSAGRPGATTSDPNGAAGRSPSFATTTALDAALGRPQRPLASLCRPGPLAAPGRPAGRDRPRPRRRLLGLSPPPGINASMPAGRTGLPHAPARVLFGVTTAASTRFSAASPGRWTHRSSLPGRPPRRPRQRRARGRDVVARIDSEAGPRRRAGEPCPQRQVRGDLAAVSRISTLARRSWPGSHRLRGTASARRACAPWTDQPPDADDVWGRQDRDSAGGSAFTVMMSAHPVGELAAARRPAIEG